MMKLFFKFELSKVRKYFATKRSAKIITSILFLIVFGTISAGIYGFFVSGFRYINSESEETIRLALTLFLYEVFLIVLSSIIIFSGIVSGIFNLFRGGYNNWIISSPKYKYFPRFIFLKSITTTLLPLVVMFVPTVLALTKVYSLNALAIITIIVSVLFLLVILNAITLSILLLIATIYYYVTKIIPIVQFTLRGLIFCLFIFAGLIAFKMYSVFIHVDLIQFFKAMMVNETVSISSIGNYFNLLPTHPLAMMILHFQNHQIVLSIWNFATISALALFFGAVWWKFSINFYPLWQKLQEGAQVNTKLNVGTSVSAPYYFLGGSLIALFKKEFLISSRNWKGLLWFFFLMFIWLLQIVANLVLGQNIRKHEYDIVEKIVSLQLIQYIVAIYFMSSFALRFVFPSFSTEKKMSWVVNSAPISFKKIFYGKYLFYTAFFLVVGICMNYVNGLILHLPFTHVFYSTTLFITAIIFIVTLALSLGAIFPSTETDDPEASSTSMPGLLFTAFALMYGALSDFVLYLTLTKESILWFIACVISTLIFTLIILLNTPRIVNAKSD